MLFFAVPVIGADTVGLQPDLFYLIYFSVAVLWFAAFLATFRSQLHDLWRLNLMWSLAVGAFAGIGVTAIVFGSAGTVAALRPVGVDRRRSAQAMDDGGMSRRSDMSSGTGQLHAVGRAG